MSTVAGRAGLLGEATLRPRPCPGLPAPRLLTLDNGLRAVLQEDSRLPLVASHLCYLGGSAAEPGDRPGLAHLCEHLALGGAEGEYSRPIELAGGRLEGFTFHDRTSFQVDLPSPGWRLALSIEARRMLRSRAVAPGAVERQRRVLLEEIRQREEGGARERVVEEIQRRLYPQGHPYATRPLGTAEGLGAIGVEDVERYLSANYRPERAVLAVVGRFDRGEAAAEIPRLFTEPAGSAPAALAAPVRRLGRRLGRRLRRPGSETLRVPGVRPALHVAFSGPGSGRAGWYEGLLWIRCAAIGPASALQRRLRERGLIAGVRAGAVHLRDATTFCLEFVPAAGVGLERLERRVDEAIESLLDEGFDAALKGRCVKQAFQEHYIGLQNLARRAEYLACHLAFTGEAPDLDRHAERLRAIGAEELESFGREYARREQRLVLAALPCEVPA